MNVEFFIFLIFMSLISFAVAFIAYFMVVRCWGREGTKAKLGAMFLVPACVVLFDFICFAAPQKYRYVIGAIPLLVIGGLYFYARFFRAELIGAADPTPMELAKQNQEPKKFSKKSERIHAAREKRGRK